MDNIKIRDRGLFVDYLPTKLHKDVIYFAVDTCQLLLNGKLYGDKVLVVKAININDETLSGFPAKITFDLGSDDYNKIFKSNSLETLIVLFDNPITEYELTHLFFRHLKDESFESEYKKIWTLDSPFFADLSIRGELITYPTYMNCELNFDTSEDYKALHKLQNQINSESSIILDKWTAKEGSNYTNDSKDITTAIYDLDLALKTEETARIKEDKILTDKYEELKEYTDNIKEPHVIKITSIPTTITDTTIKLEIIDAYNKECPIFVEYTSRNNITFFRADVFITNSGVLLSFKASVVNTPNSRTDTMPDNQEIYAIKANLTSNVSITLELTRLNEVKNKVDKIPGKGLSEEDFTHTYRNKLDELIEGKLLIDLADTTTAKAKLNQALGLLTANETNPVLKFNRWNYIYNSKYEVPPTIPNTANRPEITTPDKCEYKVTSLSYTNGNWTLIGASTVHEKGNRFYSTISYTSNTLTISFHEITPKSIGLGNVDNTSDKDKPVSDAVKTLVLNTKTELNTAITNEVNRAKGQEDKIEAAVGLNADGTHKKTTGNYTSTATTIAGEISALDTQVKKNQDAITKLNADAFTTGSVANSIKTSIEALDVTDSAVSGLYVSSVSETNGKIKVSRGTIATSPLNNYTKGTSAASVTASDTINTAISKLENLVDSTKNAINNLDYADSAVSNLFVTSVSQTNGLIEVKRARPTASNISNTAITASDTQVGLSGTNVQTTIGNIATAIKNEEKARISSDNTLQSNINSIKGTIDNYTVNSKKISTNPVLNGADIKATNYAKPSTTVAIAATDTINLALGKLEKKADDHIANKSNPHSVTKSQVGLSNVNNTSDADKPVSTAQAAAIKVVQDALNTHKADTANPHKVTKALIGLSNVDNTSDTNKPVSTAQATAIADAKKAGTDAQANLTSHINNKSNPHKVTKAQVGLGNVTNESKATMFTNPTFTGTPTAPTAATNTNNTLIATTLFVLTAIDTKLAANDAMLFKGTIGTEGTVTALPNTHNAGWTYKVITAGTYAGLVCQVGDLIMCIKDGAAANNADWTVVQTNIDGAVTGPASSTDNHVATFNGATGKIIKDSGVTASSGNITATKYVKSGGTSAQFLKADGSVDSNTYLTTSTASSTYVKKTGDTMTGELTATRLVSQSSNDAKIVLNNIDTETKYQYISFRQDNSEYGTLGTFRDDTLRWNRNILWHSGNDGSGSRLDADLLDGKHREEILRIGRDPSATTSLNNRVVSNGIDLFSWSYATASNVNGQPSGDGASSAASVVTFGTVYPFQIYSDHNSTSYLYYRSYYYDTGWKAWRRFAFIDSNVASATKLQTARTLTIGNTGKTFNGSANVSWSLSEIGASAIGHTHTFESITSKPTTLAGYGILEDADNRYVNVSGDTMSGALQINIDSGTKHLGFGRASYNYIQATSSGGILAFVPNGKTISASNADLTISNNAVYPGTTNVVNLGTSSNKWDNVIATTFRGALSGNASSASKWATARTLTLTGSVTGSVSIDGSANVTLNTTTNHTHTFASLTSKPTTLSGYGITDAKIEDGIITLGKNTIKPLTTHQSLDAYLKVNGSNGTASGVSALINKLQTATATPTDATYYICQDAGGGTTYYRRPTSALWEYIKSKSNNLYVTSLDTSGNYLTWTKNGTTNNITVPYASNADKLDGVLGVNYAYANSNSLFLVDLIAKSITTALFIEKLKAFGAFNHYSWITLGMWSYDNNDTITDTGIGNIQLAGSIIEVKSVNGGNLKMIRVTTAPTITSSGAIANSVFIYRDMGPNYSPNWKRLANTTDNVASADKWHTARAIGIVNSDGTGSAVVVNVDGSINTNLRLPATIKASLTGNASSATKLQTARTINGTSFDGTANITTASWGTARNIYIADATAAHTGVAVSVNGSANATLKLPATITAALVGNASTATKLQTARTIWGQSFNGTANVSGNMTGVDNITASGTVSAATIELSYNTPFIDFHFNKSTGDYTSRIIEVTSGTLSINSTLWIKYNNNVGIGTTSPSQKLHVNGNVLASSFIKSGGTSSLFLKADGSVDSNKYLTSHLSLANYVTINTALTITGQKHFSTYSNTKPLIISREGNIAESLSIGIIDDTIRFHYKNDEVTSRILFLLENTDTESGGGANASSHYFLIAADKNGLTTTLPGTYIGSAFKKSGGTASQFLKADGSVDSNSYSLSSHTHNYLPLSGGTLTGTLGKSNNYIFKPNGGDFRTTSNYTGAICISLPANIGNTMISMWIDVYNYVTNTSFSVHVGGYTYNNNNFANKPFAMVYGATHKVRLTYDSRFKIYIGETNSLWDYPQISIRDVVLGFNPNYSNWYKDWTISFATTLPSIDQAINHYAYTTKNKPTYSDVGAAPASHTHSLYLTAHQSVTNKEATLAWNSTSTIATIGSTNITVKLPANPNTHYASSTIVGASATATANAAATNGSVFLNHIENGAVKSSHNIKGAGVTSVTSDASGIITISSTDTKNTAGSTNTSSKIFLIGATSLVANPVTYSHDTAFVGADGCLYSGGAKVLTAHLSLANYLKVDGSNGTVTGLATLLGKITDRVTIPSITSDFIFKDNNKLYNITYLNLLLSILGETDDVYLRLSGGLMTGTIRSNVTTQSFINGNKGTAIINSIATAGSYTMLAKMNSTNGYFTLGTYSSDFVLNYTAKSTVDASTNAVTHNITLLNESGGTRLDSLVVGNATGANTLVSKGYIELFTQTPFIDFHYGNSTEDYTSRIIESGSGVLSINNTIWANYSGNVGIGTSSPTAKLHVSGTITSNNTITGNKFVKSGGTSSQFLKADGSIDSNSYATSSALSTTTTTANNALKLALDGDFNHTIVLISGVIRLADNKSASSWSFTGMKHPNITGFNISVTEGLMNITPTILSGHGVNFSSILVTLQLCKHEMTVSGTILIRPLTTTSLSANNIGAHWFESFILGSMFYVREFHQSNGHNDEWSSNSWTGGGVRAINITVCGYTT